MSEAARNTRAAARGWTTRASNKLSMLVRNENTTFIELNYELEQYDKRLNTLDEAQLAVELEIDVQYLDADIDEASEFRDRVHEARVQAATRLATIASLLLCMLQGQQGGVTQVMFSPDGTKLYSGGRKDNCLRLWHLA